MKENGQIEDLSIFEVKEDDLPPNEHISLPSQLRNLPLSGEIISPVKKSESSTSIPLPLQGIDLSRALTRPELVCALTNNLPKNEYGFPKLIYRADLLDPNVFHVSGPEALEIANGQSDKYDILSSILQTALMELSYYEGFPSFSDGTPLWGKMPYESQDDFQAFETYRQLPGARQLMLLPDLYRARATELFHSCYWRIRCAASDAFGIAHMRRMREHRILTSDDHQFLAAERMLEKMKTLEASINWEVLVDDPKQYTEIMERLFKLRRQSLGQISANGSSVDAGDGITAIEMTMRRLVEQQPQQAERHEGPDISSILADPIAAKAAQELILKITTRS